MVVQVTPALAHDLPWRHGGGPFYHWAELKVSAPTLPSLTPPWRWSGSCSTSLYLEKDGSLGSPLGFCLWRWWACSVFCGVGWGKEAIVWMCYVLLDCCFPGPWTRQSRFLKAFSWGVCVLAFLDFWLLQYPVWDVCGKKKVPGLHHTVPCILSSLACLPSFHLSESSYVCFTYNVQVVPSRTIREKYLYSSSSSQKQKSAWILNMTLDL